METIENWLSGNLYVQWGSLYERTVRGPGHSQLIKINGQGIQYTRVHNHCHIRFYLSLIPNQSWLNFTACRYIKSCVLFAVSIFCYRNIFLCIWEILSEVIRVGYDSVIKCLQKSPVSPSDEPTMTNKAFSISYCSFADLSTSIIVTFIESWWLIATNFLHSQQRIKFEDIFILDEYLA